MRWLAEESDDPNKVLRIIQAAGGKIIGRTRLQKMFYLLSAAGFETSFPFEYRHYGPFSEKLARVTSLGNMEGILEEQEHPTSWGGTYSVFTSHTTLSTQVDSVQSRLISLANEANPIDLELAATAIFLAKESVKDPWAETQKRKPDKAKRIDSAKRLYEQLRSLPLPTALPQFGE